MHRNKWKWKHNNPKPVGHYKSSVKRKVHSYTGIPQEIRKSEINNLILHLKQLEKKELENPRVSRRREILKIRAEINTKETKETIAKINKEITPILLKLFQKIAEEGKLLNSFYEATITLIPKPDKDAIKKKQNLQANITDEHRCKTP